MNAHTTNLCRVVLSRGKNQGQICYNVNKKCRHKVRYCPYCGTEFTMETSYYRHIKHCEGTEIKKAHRKVLINTKPIVSNKYDVNKYDVNKYDVNKYDLNKYDVNKLIDRISLLEQKLEQLKTRPTTTVHNWNIVLGSNFYKELVQKMGQESAIDYLMEIASEKKHIDLISKLYLEGNDPSDYPVACRDQDHFRYITAEHKIVDDKGGHNISKYVSTGVMDALILAANDTITEQLNNNIDDPHEKLSVIQNHILKLNGMTKEYIINKLAELTNNPNHPFFKVKENTSCP
uniref:Uncharacterized protein n=1 Tax=viral metagenome TaxID=1070528 RepID=A0A6C0J4K1_9ZZZZ